MKAHQMFFRLLKLVSVLVIAFAPGPAASGELVAKLPQVMNPFFVTIADGRLYVVENTPAVHYFKIGERGVSFVRTFGREGQGPGEFDFIYLVRVYGDHLDVPGSHKLARFSLDGEYLDEIKFPVGVFKGGIYRLGGNFLARDLSIGPQGSSSTIRLYDKDFKQIREIGAQKEPLSFEKINLVGDYYSARVSGDLIFTIFSGKESIVTVYDGSGIKQGEVRLPLDPQKITPALKEAILKPIRDDPEMKPMWNEFEKRIIFPDATPGLDYFEVSDGKFVTRTYKYREDTVEFAVLDRQGRELKRLFLPFTGRLSNGILFCFHQGRYFYLRENAEGDGWELHAEKVW